MKIILKSSLFLLLLSVFAGCSVSAPRVDGESTPGRGGGRSYSVVLSGAAERVAAGQLYFLAPKPDGSPWSSEDKRCVEILNRALQMSGMAPAGSASEADVVIKIHFPQVGQAKGFTFAAMMGSYRHSAELEARDGQDRMLWRLKAHLDFELNDRQKIFPYLALAMVGRFGANLNEESVSVDEFDLRLGKLTEG